ncbi:unnamed protein product, partial [Ectocarpus sp. 4 AP-2014]
LLQTHFSAQRERAAHHVAFCSEACAPVPVPPLLSPPLPTTSLRYPFSCQDRSRVGPWKARRLEVALSALLPIVLESCEGEADDPPPTISRAEERPRARPPSVSLITEDERGPCPFTSVSKTGS